MKEKRKQKYLMKCCRKYWYFFVLEMILSYMLAAAVVRGNTMLGTVIDDMLSGEQVKPETFIFPLTVLIAAGFVFAFGKSVCASLFAIRVQAMYKNMVAYKLYTLEYRYFDKNGSASVLNKVNSDIAELDALLEQNVPELCTNVIAMLIYAIYIGQINIGLLLLMVVCYPFIFYFTNRVVKKIEALKKVFRQKSDIITEISQDCVSGILVLRSFGAEEHFQKKLNRAADDLVANEEKRVRISNNAIIVRRLLQWMPNIVCAVYAYVMVLQGTISLGELVIFLVILQRFVDAFVGIPFNLVDARENLVCIRRVEEIMQQKDEKKGTATKGRKTQTAIALENVCFSYVEGSPVLKGLSLKVRRNEHIAFVGDSGSGKSTIFHLLCGFYTADSGSYKLFGRKFGEWQPEAARENIALVSQNVFLFPGSIRENVRYGRAEANDKQIEEACQNAGIHDFIAGLPEGYDSIVGERGILLSGGERQRISIARAFLKDAPVLLMDEPTSAVDVETERLIQKAMNRLSENRTCITIAHRLSTIQNADKIFVLKEGKIAEAGTHTQLMQKQGVYAALYGREQTIKEGEA